MKRFMIVMMASTAIAFPAFARTPPKHRVPVMASDIGPVSPVSSVYFGGEYRGADPDPDIRLDLRRTSPHGGE